MSIDSATLQNRLDVLREKHGVPGASVAVLSGDEVTAAASGVLNLATGVEATPDSLFQIGSITKVWTATVIMQLASEGAIDIDAPVRRYLPGFRVGDERVAEQVTIRHLLTHTSGIDGDHFADTGRGDDVLEKYVETCAPLAQVHPLGATMSYCNTGFSVLGRVIEVVTGGVWDAAIRSRLVEPLGLTHTATLPEEVLRFRAAMGHIQPPGQDLQPAPVWGLPRSAGPAGLICTTATDLIEFARLHLGTAFTAMQQPQVEVPSGGIGLFPQHWGLGWGVYTWDDRTVIGHDGGTIGQTAFLRIVPDADAAFVLLTNGGSPYALFQDLCSEALAEAAGLEMSPAVTPPPAPPAIDAARYTGIYEREGSRVEVVERDGGIVGIQTMTGPAAAMTPEPFETPFVAFDAGRDLFLTQHPVAADMWLTVKFLTLSDGSRCVHTGGRATPRVG